MAERDPSELALAAAFRAYLEDAPTEVRATELAHRFASAYPHGRGLTGRLGFRLTPAMAWLLLLAGLLAALAVGGLVAGGWHQDLAVVIAPSPTPTGAPVATPTPTPGASALSQMTTVRFGQTATLLPDGRVLITGGYSAPAQASASAELYDPSTGTFSRTGSMETPRACHDTTTLADGRVLIVGDGVSPTAEIYDPETGTFRPTGSMKTARCGPSATLLADGRVLVAGGLADDPNATGETVALTSAEIYDPKKGTFSPTGSLTTARFGQPATLLADGRVLIAGSQYRVSVASAELYDPKTGTFHVTGPMTTAGGVTATRLLDGRVLITGGGNGSKAEVYDPTTGTFKPTGSMKTARWQQTATLLPDGRVLVAGGRDPNAKESNFTLASAELYDPMKGTFSPTGSLTTARSGPTATLLADGRVLIAGGLGDDPNTMGDTVALTSAELYDPATGTFGPTGPSAPGD